MNVDAKLAEARKLQEEGRAAEATAALADILQMQPRHFEAVHLLGVIAAQAGDMGRAVARFAEATGIEPGNAVAHNNLGNALAHFGRHAVALQSYDRAVQLRPDYALAHNNRGATLAALKQHAAALESYDRAIVLKADFAEAHNNRGTLLTELKRQGEAVESYNRALALRPTFIQAHHNRGNALRALWQLDEALQAYDRALALDRHYVPALIDRGVALAFTRQYQAALDSFERALALKPTSAEALSNRATVLAKLGRAADAVPALARLLDVAPDWEYLAGDLLHAKMLCCDWNGLAELATTVQHGVAAGRKVITPFGYQAVSECERDLRVCAETFSADRYPAATIDVAVRKHSGSKIRIGYSSGEFREQATSILMTELWELHDRSRFELVAFDNGWDDGSPRRARIVAAFDEMIDITRMSDAEAASLVNRKGIGIFVNLNGFFGDMRQGVFARRPSPIQVNYLGFPGTLGAAYMDYLVADETVIPAASRRYYTEKIAVLPGCYQPNDRRRPIADRVPTRADLGLPSDSLVFCCFNKNYKITPALFDVWMRLLVQIEGSVLWLIQDSQASADNLRREAMARGVSADRLVFARRCPLAEHLARHRAADLFLDTLPYNAHTTASDALWAGLPVLTAAGKTFPGRVGASLLKAIGLSEMIMPSLQEYEARALELARNRAELEAIRRKLEANRATAPLFDTPRFARHIEEAYLRMHERHQAGLPPDHIEVPA